MATKTKHRDYSPLILLVVLMIFFSALSLAIGHLTHQHYGIVFGEVMLGFQFLAKILRSNLWLFVGLAALLAAPKLNARNPPEEDMPGAPHDSKKPNRNRQRKQKQIKSPHFRLGLSEQDHCDENRQSRKPEFSLIPLRVYTGTVLPSTLKIGASEWDVRIAPIPPDEEAYGICQREQHRITIEERLCDPEREETLLHEALHAVCEQAGIGENEKLTEEQFISRLSPSLYAMMKDNGFWPAK
jgi:hypothetical protein